VSLMVKATWDVPVEDDVSDVACVVGGNLATGEGGHWAPIERA